MFPLSFTHSYLKRGSLLMILPLSACSSIYSDTFDCGVGKGVNCKSISEVNAMVTRGKLGQTGEPQVRHDPATDPVSTSLDPAPALPSLEAISASTPQSVRRLPEQTLRVWIPPHLEESGTWSGGRYLYTVVAPGKWVPSQGPSAGRPKILNPRVGPASVSQSKE